MQDPLPDAVVNELDIFPDEAVSLDEVMHAPQQLAQNNDMEIDNTPMPFAPTTQVGTA